MSHDIELSVVVPLYNEESVICEMYCRLGKVLAAITESYEIIMVNDGSHDQTVQLAKEICAQDRRVKLISFSRNFGHQVAITAGMDKASGKAVVIIDADLQDPPEIICKMVEKWRQGFHVVYGVRQKRSGESWFKLFTAAFFYRVLKRMTAVDIPVDTGDFRLIDWRVLQEFKKMREKARYVRGMISWVGFRQTAVYYERNERHSGETKYPFKKMLRFALDGMFSFSHVPLQMASFFGFLSAGVSFFYMVYGFVIKIFFPEQAIPGWASLFSAVLFIGGVQLVCLGVMGEYIGRIYEEIKKRPLYIVDQELNFPG